MASHAARRALWRGHVEALLASGLPRTAFCAQRGLSRSALYRWEQRLRRESGESPTRKVKGGATFVPLRVAPAAPAAALALQVGGGMRLELPRDTDAAWLALLLRSLAGC